MFEIKRLFHILNFKIWNRNRLSARWSPHRRWSPWRKHLHSRDLSSATKPSPRAMILAHASTRPKCVPCTHLVVATTAPTATSRTTRASFARSRIFVRLVSATSSCAPERARPAIVVTLMATRISELRTRFSRPASAPSGATEIVR